MAEAFIAHIKSEGQRKASVVERELRRNFVDKWKARPIASITPQDVEEVIEATVKRGKRAQAHNLLGHVRRFFNWVLSKPKYGLTHSPCDRLKPEQLIGERAKRDRVLTNQELSAFWKATERTRYPYGPVYRLLALTGLRLSDVCEAPWSEFDFEQRLWTINKMRMKAGKAHIVPLTDEMMEILQSLPRFEKGNFIFSASFGKRPIRANHFSKPKRRLDGFMLEALREFGEKRGDDPEQVTLADWVNHDLRRTVRTNLSALKVPEEVREAVLAHTRPGIKGVYDHYQYVDEKRDALEKWVARLRNIVEPAPTNVVSLRAV